PVEHCAQVGGLVDDVGVLEHAIDPARHGDARLGHQVGRGVPALDPFVVDAPRVGEVLPRTFGQAIVARQGVRVGPHVGGALHVVVAAEDVGATAGTADVAQRQLQDARGAHHGVADTVLRLSHAPHHGARAVLVQRLGHAEHGGFVNAT